MENTRWPYFNPNYETICSSFNSPKYGDLYHTPPSRTCVALSLLLYLILPSPSCQRFPCKTELGTCIFDVQGDD
jgi:hypothetical protein